MVLWFRRGLAPGRQPAAIQGKTKSKTTPRERDYRLQHQGGKVDKKQKEKAECRYNRKGNYRHK
jgi:hypothetical protein